MQHGSLAAVLHDTALFSASGGSAPGCRADSFRQSFPALFQRSGEIRWL